MPCQLQFWNNRVHVWCPHTGGEGKGREGWGRGQRWKMVNSLKQKGWRSNIVNKEQLIRHLKLHLPCSKGIHCTSPRHVWMHIAHNKMVVVIMMMYGSGWVKQTAMWTHVWPCVSCPVMSCLRVCSPVWEISYMLFPLEVRSPRPHTSSSSILQPTTSCIISMAHQHQSSKDLDVSWLLTCRQWLTVSMKQA